MKKAEDSNTIVEKPPIKEIFSGLKDFRLTAICIIIFFNMFSRQGIFQTIFQLYLNSYLLFPVERIGIILSSSIAGRVIAIMVAGVLSDRFGRKPVLLIGFALSATSLFSLTILKNFGLMLVACFILGMGEGFDTTTLIALLFDIAPASIRGGVIGLYRTFHDIGGFLGPIILMILYALSGPRIPFYISTLFAITNFIIILRIKK
jgi:MFS family permease